jgi:DNA-binding beta-propeller fold protein YncE
MLLTNFRFLLACFLIATSQVSFAATYQLGSPISLGGSGGWDYLFADAANRKLYVSHNAEVFVVDLDSQKPVGKVSGLGGVHGIAVDDRAGQGFISDGRNNEVVVFDLKSFAVKNKIKAGTNPDGIVFDAFSNRVFAFNGRSQDATVIDARTGNVDQTVKLDGKPEFPVSDKKGSVYVNIEDKNEIERIDAKTLAVKAQWPIAPCESPSGLAMDVARRRLFAVCSNKMMAVVDADSGKVVATPAIDEGPDAAAFDPQTGLAFSSNGRSGTVTVIQGTDKKKYQVQETVHTAPGARTMALDTKTHRIYLSDADFAPVAGSQSGGPLARPQAVPGSFHLLVLERE